MLKEEDLGAAYRRCGKSFKGPLGQHFIVLKDQLMSQSIPTQGTRRGDGQTQRGSFRQGDQTRGRGFPRGGNGSSRKRKHDDKPNLGPRRAPGSGSGASNRGAKAPRGGGWA